MTQQIPGSLEYTINPLKSKNKTTRISAKPIFIKFI